MAANTSQNETTVRRLLETLNGLWTACKNAFQTLGNLVTSWGSTPSDTKYPSEKLVKTSLDAKASSTHTHSVKINGATKTIAASGGTSVDLDYHPTARAVTATTVKNAIQELRILPGGSVGSVQLTADNSVENVKIPAGWYNYIWTPHRAGASGGDNQNYGSLVLMSMVSTSPQTFVVEGANLADASPVYRCRLLSQVAAMGSAYFGSNAKYRKIGTLSGPGSTGDTCATFLVCVNIANVTKQSGILNVNIRNGGGTYTFNISLTELTGAESWTSKLKLFKNGGNLYLYGLGASGAYYSVEVTPLAVTDLTGTQFPGMWVPDTSNTDESSVSYTAITYGTTQYVAKSSTSGVLMNDGTVTTKNYSGASTTGKTYYVVGAEGSDAGWKDTKMLAGIRTYNDSSNGHILYVGNSSGTSGTIDKGRVYLATGKGANVRLEPNGSLASNVDITLPNSSGTLALLGDLNADVRYKRWKQSGGGWANVATLTYTFGSSANKISIFEFGYFATSTLVRYGTLTIAVHGSSSVGGALEATLRIDSLYSDIGNDTKLDACLETVGNTGDECTVNLWLYLTDTTYAYAWLRHMTSMQGSGGITPNQWVYTNQDTGGSAKPTASGTTRIFNAAKTLIAISSGDYRTQGLQAAYATQSGFANESTYATKIGSSASHPQIGGPKIPVYVDEYGNVIECDSPSTWIIGFASRASKLYASSYGASNIPFFLKDDGESWGDANQAFRIPHTVARWHMEMNNGTVTGIGVQHFTSRFLGGPSDDLILVLRTPSTSVLQLVVDARSTSSWYGGQVWGTMKWDSQTGSNINSNIERIGDSNLSGDVVLASRNISVNNVQDIQGHALFAICTGDFLHKFVVDMEISVIKPNASSTLCYVSVMSKCFEEDYLH